MSRFMRSTETMLRDIAGAPIVAENKSAAGNASAVAMLCEVPWSLMTRANGTAFIMPGVQSADVDFRAVFATRGDAEDAMAAWNATHGVESVFRHLLDTFDKLTLADQQHFLTCLWDSDNAAFTDDLCETIADAWRRGR